MQAPAAMFIETAQNHIKAGEHAGGSKWLQESQVKELLSAIPDTSTMANKAEEFTEGYVLGLETARVILASSPLLMVKGVVASDVL